MPDVTELADPSKAAPRAGRVSVIVPTLNTARTLRACLESVRSQDHGDIELIVVDNWSTDGTLDVARSLADVVEQAGPERSAQRNRGIAISTGEWVMWIDADMVLSPSCVSTALAVAGGAGVEAVAIPEATVGPGFWTACRALERSCYVDSPALHNARLLRRDILTRVGGFDESMSGPEDAHLRHRLRQAGVAVALTPVLIEHDEGRLTLGAVWRKRVYYGRSLPSFAAANPGMVREQGAGTFTAFGRNRRRLLRSPGLTAGMLGLRAVEAVAYAVGAYQGHRARPRGPSSR